MFQLRPCPKASSSDLDKAQSPAHTLATVRSIVDQSGLHVVAETRRIDTGRLGIPVFLSVCGADARAVMPTRKQMGKGASEEQAEASALMELMERFSFFSFWEREHPRLTWSQAHERFGQELIPVERIVHSVHDAISHEAAIQILDLVPWRFAQVMDLASGTTFWAPVDWFKKLNEFNGSCAGNTMEEALLQGLCEVVERHTSCLWDRQRPCTPTIDPASAQDPVLQELLKKFQTAGVRVWLKDFSLGMPVPTVAAIAYDPATYPLRSEIVFTAGTATSPEKAAIRALTEVAQLAGDFITGSCYEASGLPKFLRLDDLAWVEEGPEIPLASLPSIWHHDIAQELTTLSRALAEMGMPPLAVDTTHPVLHIPAAYVMVPGMLFRERTPQASLGLFVGRILAEEADLTQAHQGLEVLQRLVPKAPYLPFFQGLVNLRERDFREAAALFAAAEPHQADADDKGLCAFYQAYALTQEGLWEAALPHLDRAIAHCPEVKEYYNLRGVAYFHQANYAAAAANFELVLELDSGSITDLANLGVCHKLLGHTDLAREMLTRALAVDPSLDYARAHLEELNP
jgi:ribosomal protein S12 methylthiotransferase accessory factor